MQIFFYRSHCTFFSDLTTTHDSWFDNRFQSKVWNFSRWSKFSSLSRKERDRRLLEQSFAEGNHLYEILETTCIIVGLGCSGVIYTRARCTGGTRFPHCRPTVGNFVSHLSALWDRCLFFPLEESCMLARLLALFRAVVTRVPRTTWNVLCSTLVLPSRCHDSDLITSFFCLVIYFRTGSTVLNPLFCNIKSHSCVRNR